jgi:hypothetical protein
LVIIKKLIELKNNLYSSELQLLKNLIITYTEMPDTENKTYLKFPDNFKRILINKHPINLLVYKNTPLNNKFIEWIIREKSKELVNHFNNHKLSENKILNMTKTINQKYSTLEKIDKKIKESEDDYNTIYNNFNIQFVNLEFHDYNCDTKCVETVVNTLINRYIFYVKLMIKYYDIKIRN